MNFTARPWLFRYKSQNLEAIDEEDGVCSQASFGGESRQGALAGGGGSLPHNFSAVLYAYILRHYLMQLGAGHTGSWVLHKNSVCMAAMCGIEAYTCRWFWQLCK